MDWKHRRASIQTQTHSHKSSNSYKVHTKGEINYQLHGNVWFLLPLTGLNCNMKKINVTSLSPWVTKKSEQIIFLYEQHSCSYHCCCSFWRTYVRMFSWGWEWNFAPAWHEAQRAVQFAGHTTISLLTDSHICWWKAHIAPLTALLLEIAQ